MRQSTKENIVKFMDNIQHSLAIIPNDKLLHSFYFTLLYAVLSTYNSSVALTVVYVMAVLKECYDQFKYGGFDYKDIIASVFLPTLLYLAAIVNYVLETGTTTNADDSRFLLVSILVLTIPLAKLIGIKINSINK